MSDGNDVLIRVAGADLPDSSLHAHRGYVPAFAARCHDATGFLPELATEVRVALGDGLEMHPIPRPKVHFAQLWAVWQPDVACCFYGTGCVSRPCEVR